MDYKAFLENKTVVSKDTGFTIKREDLNSNLFEYQKDIVVWSLKKGKSAIFADCGLGKSLMQLEWSNKVHERTNGPILILAPLAVTLILLSSSNF